ncbi:MAG: hypothetical protein LC650_01160 [Actinobacteria bacterium]|nr:hypothetical protein [Actinomycetota bacterium]
MYGGMIASVVLISFFRPIVSLAILETNAALYPVLQALIAGLIVPLGIYYGINLGPMTTILTWLYNWMNGEFSFDNNGWDFLFVVIRVVAHILVSWFSGIVYFWLRGSVAMSAAFSLQNVSPLSDFGAYFVFACIALIFYLFELLTVTWSRDGYGVYTVYLMVYVGISYSGFVIIQDVVDFGMTMAVAAATQTYPIGILWIFLLMLAMVGLAALKYFVFFSNRINTLAKARDNNGDAVETESMLNSPDPLPPAPTVCKRPMNAQMASNKRYRKVRANAPRPGADFNGVFMAENSVDM